MSNLSEARKAWIFLTDHMAFIQFYKIKDTWMFDQGFHKSLEIDYFDDISGGGIYFECGKFSIEANGFYHDYELDCEANDFNTVVIELAKKVRDKFGDRSIDSFFIEERCFKDYPYIECYEIANMIEYCDNYGIEVPKEIVAKYGRK